MARQRETHQKTPAGLFKRCKHIDWRKCECPWWAKFRGQRTSLDKWWGVPIDSYEAAYKAFVAFQNAVNEGKFVPRQRRIEVEKKDGTTFGDVIDSYASTYGVDITDDKKVGRDRCGQFGNEVGYDLITLKKELGTELVTDLAANPLKVRTWFNGFIARRNADRKKANQTPLAPRSINAWRIRGIGLFSYVAEQMPEIRLLSNPFKRMEEPKGCKVNRSVRFTLAQLQALYEAIPKLSVQRNDQDFMVKHLAEEMKIRFLLAVLTGVRVDEMLHLRMPRIDWTDWTIHLPFAETKGGKSTGRDETLYLDWLEEDPEIGHWVTDLKAELQKRRFFKEPHDYVAARYDGRPTASFKKPARRLFELAGVKWSRRLDPNTGKPMGLCWHDLRHEAISRLAELSDSNASKIMAFARHKDLNTSQGYIEIAKDRHQELRKRKRA